MQFSCLLYTSLMALKATCSSSVGVIGRTGVGLNDTKCGIVNFFFVLRFPPILVVTAVCSGLHLRREQDLGIGHAVCL